MLVGEGRIAAGAGQALGMQAGDDGRRGVPRHVRVPAAAEGMDAGREPEPAVPAADPLHVVRVPVLGGGVCEQIAPAPSKGLELKRRETLAGQHQKVVLKKEIAQFRDHGGIAVTSEVDAFDAGTHGDARRSYRDVHVLSRFCHCRSPLGLS